MTETEFSSADWQVGPVQLWMRPHVPGERGEPQARGLLGPVLGVEAARLPLRRDDRGWPWLDAPLRHWGTGWSHSGDRLLVGLGEHVRVGVDLERQRSRPRMMDVAQRFFHPDEVAMLEELEQVSRQSLFFRLWCAKEATLKAQGHGIAFGLHRLAFAVGATGLVLGWCDPELGDAGSWHLHEWDAGGGYRAALAWYPDAAGLR